MREIACFRLRSTLLLIFLLTATTAQWNDWTVEPYQQVDDQAEGVQITVYPSEQNIREGREGTFDCRARTTDGLTYPEVRWSRQGGPLPSSAYESGGRLTFTSVSQSDSGRYICSTTYRGRNYDAYTQLNVQAYGPQEYQSMLPQTGVCRADERACGNEECVKTEYICDGEPDCRDRTDEQNCPSLRSCEPNEFRCGNGRCVQKMWLCDGDNDCGDNSDEQNCERRPSAGGCTATEFRCGDGQQCVPQSFHCDGTNDCHDGSDEIGCVQPTVVQAPQTNVQVNAGGTFQLTCKAVAVPEPYINWRLNWGPVCDPPRCQQQSEGGLGTLTVTNAQALDQGAYTCEAINVKGRVLATPDCIVRIVSIPGPEPQPPPQPQPQPISHCHPAGSISPEPDYTGHCQCKALTVGPSCDQCSSGAYHLHEKASQGCLKCFCFGVTDQCRSAPWYRTKDKLIFTGESQGVVISNFDGHERSTSFSYSTIGMVTHNEPHYDTLYWKLPSRFIGNKITAYGGELAFDLQYSCSGYVNNEPLVVLKGNQMTLVHRPRNAEQTFAPGRSFRITVDTYEANYEHTDGRPASREDFMMVLAKLDDMFIRATHCYGQESTSLGDVTWEIAVDRDTQERLALEVEQCSCPPGYTGLSCEECAPGYERSGQGPYLGTCVPAQQRAQCSLAGSVSNQPAYDGRCQCKAYATGAMCNHCTPNSFYLSASNPQGCIPCFCSGVTQSCGSSNYHRSQIIIDYGTGSTDQLEVSSSDIHSPYRPQSPPQLSGSDITFSAFYELPGQTLYWKLPEPFLGNKVTSYGGTLKYVFKFSGTGPQNTDADVILRGNDIVLYYKHRDPIYPDRENFVEVKLFEDNWHRVDGQAATREHILMTLADLDTILIKMSILDDCSSSSLISVSLEYAVPHFSGREVAYEVEQCICPPGYIGTSCEDCAPGYSRTGGGLYLGLCERCECHGHASQCDKEHGFCVDCQHNTEGDQCERCKPGFAGDARRGTPHDCQPAQTRPPCLCNNHSPRGCDSFGRCLLCEHNTEGYHCEQCKRGYYGDATRGTPYDCTPCPCPGASDCFLDAYGQVQCRNCPAGLTGRLCDQCAPGYTRSRTRGRFDEGRSCEPIGRVEDTNVVFVPTPEAHGVPLRVQIDPPKNLRAQIGGRARWYCRVIGHRAPGLRLEWQKVGTNTLPSNAAVYDGELIIEDITESNEGQYRCTATGDHQYATDDATLEVSPTRDVGTGGPPPVMVDPLEQTVNENDPATFRCWVPGLASCELNWHKEHVGGPLPYGVYQNGGVLKIPRAQLVDAGNYLCTATNEYGTGESPPARLNVNRLQQRPRVDPQENTVGDGEPARFRCWVPGEPTARLSWKMKGGGLLPPGVYEQEGMLNIPSAERSHAGSYVCTASDPERRHPPLDSPAAKLIVKAANIPQIDPLEQTVTEGEPAQFRCSVPGNPHAQLRWRRVDGRPLGYGFSDRQGVLSTSRVEMSDAGTYVCSARDPETGIPTDSPHAQLYVQPIRRTPQMSELSQPPSVDPREQTVNEGDPVQFRCWVPNNPNARLRWSKVNRAPLPYGASDDGSGMLYIPRTQLADSDYYICTAFDFNDNALHESEPAKLEVEPLDKQVLTRYPSRAERSRPEVDPLEQTILEGAPAHIRCFVPGESHPPLTWRRSYGEMPEDASQADGNLYISQTRSEDAGEYICTLETPDGGIDAPVARIHVGTPILPEVDPISQTVDEGTPAQIRCWVTGNPSAHLRWHKEGGELPYGSYESQGTLIIPRVTSENIGSYICTAQDPHDGPPAHSHPAAIHIRQAQTPQVDPPTQTVDEGTPSRVRCWVPGNPDAQLSWSKEGGELPYGAEDAHGILTIPKTMIDDAGNYICAAQDPHGGPPVHSSPAKINVKQVEGPEVDPSTQTVDEGSPSRIRCWVPGNQNAQLSWSKESGDLPYGAENTRGILTIPKTMMEDAGNYICSAQDPHGGLELRSSPATINVRQVGAPPRPVATPSDQIVKSGEPARFHCDANSDTPAQIKWGYQSADGPLRGDVVREGDDVVIHAADESIAGEYVCSATNEVGTGEAEPVRLHVSENEEPPTAQVVPRVWNGQPGDNHRFQCITTGIPTPQITWTGPDGESLPRDVTDVGDGFLEFVDGRSDMNGDYTCTAVNVVGEASDHGTVNIGSSLTIRTRPAGPSIVLTVGEPLEVECEAVGDPEPEVEWLHDPGPERGDLPDDFKPVTISERFIRHPNIGLGNAGVYTCKGSNSQASAMKDIHIKVVEASRVATVSVLGGSTQWLQSGKPANVICAATGSELVDRVQWVKIDGVMPDNAEEKEQGLLHFSTFTNAESGEYECRGYRNDELIGSNRALLYTINNGPLGASHVEIEGPSVRVVKQGDPIELKCSVEGGESDGVKFEWSLLRSGSIIRQFSEANTLKIRRADPSNDYGVYRCEVENDDGELLGQAYTAVTVGYTDPSNAQIVKFDEKADAYIECPVYRIPGAEVHWRKEDGELPETAETVGSKLMIKGFDDEATGIYICKVVVDGKEIEGYVKAEIYVPDTIIQVLLESSSESIALGDRAWFDCKVTGDPDAEIVWTKEEDELPDNAQVTGNRLLFVNVQEDNGGIYKCRAKTKAGPLETRTVLNVGGIKRKRKHLLNKKTKRAFKKTKKSSLSSVFGNWFISN